MTRTVGKYTGSLADLLKTYRYQPKLTARLDDLGPEPFDQPLVNEIVLWKVNRYAELSPATLDALNTAGSIRPGEHAHASWILELLLSETGVDLPMASTFLRFRNRETFQIIDRHAYRAVFGVDYPLHTNSTADAKISRYLHYIDALRELALVKHLPFHDLDRILYLFDKAKNGPLTQCRDTSMK